MKVELLPGILTHSYQEYVARLELVEVSNAKWAHVDIADGQFVPNITVMPHEIMGVPTKLNLEAHLMTYGPEKYFSNLAVAGIKRVLIHREAFNSLEECAQVLKDAGNYFNEVGLVVNPDTDVESYAELPITVIQCMGIHPGFSGQPFLVETYDTIEKIRLQHLHLTLAIDGGVSEENIKQLQTAGITRFVMSSQLFATNSVAQNFQYFIQLVSGAL